MKTHELLFTAASYIDKYGWHQGDYANHMCAGGYCSDDHIEHRTDPPKVCLLGALAISYGVHLEDTNEDEPFTYHLFSSECDLAADAVASYLELDISETPSTYLLSEWNDDETRTQAQVVNTLRAVGFREHNRAIEGTNGTGDLHNRLLEVPAR